MRRLILGIAGALIAGRRGAHAQSFPSRPITLIVPFPPGGSTDTAARILADKMRPILGQPVIIENVGGAGGSIAVGRVARAAPDGYTIDIGQWDTHVGSIIYNITYDLQKDFDPIGLISVNPQLMVGEEEPAGQPAQRAGRLDEGQSGRSQVRQPERGRARDRHPDGEGHRHQGDLHSLSRRGAGDDRPGLGPGRSSGRSRAPRRCRRCAPAPSRRSPTCRRSARRRCRTFRPPTRPACRACTCRAGSASSGPRACRRRRSTSSTARCGRCSPIRRCKARFTELGLDVASRAAADARRSRGLPEGRDRQVVADHQGRQHQTGLTDSGGV